jgi:hypothetical protein
MSTAPKPFPLYTDGASVFFTTDGVNFTKVGGGTGGVATVTGIAAGIVDNTDPANPVVQAQFGSDTTVKLPNSASALVSALELIASLTTNTAGSEVSQWLIKLLSAGAQVSSYVLGVLGLTVPVGSTAVPSINFAGDTTSGMYRQNTGDMRLIDRAVGCLSWGQAGILNLLTATGFFWSNGTGTYQQGPNNANLGLRGAATGNAEVGTSGAIATTATAGFINMPSCAGAPTGVPANVSTGKVPHVVDTANSKVWYNIGGTWKGVVVA